MVETACRLGITLVDTSPLYGRSEYRVGIALKRNKFSDLIISTKTGTHPERQYSYSNEDLRWSFNNSLRMLGRICVDVAMIHDPPSMQPVFKSGHGFDTMEELRKEGKLRYIGLGVRDHSFHIEAIKAGKVDVILTYGDFNLVRRTARSLIDMAYNEGVGVFLGSPQMLGLLARGEPAHVAKEQLNLTNWFNDGDFKTAQEWWLWCRERDIQLRHLNMRYIMNNPKIGCVLTGGATVEELEQNIHEALTPIPKDIWNEAMERIVMLDEKASR